MNIRTIMVAAGIIVLTAFSSLAYRGARRGDARFALTDLGVPTGAVFSVAGGLNSTGDVVGIVALDKDKLNSLHAAVWKDGQLSDLGKQPGGTFYRAVGINASGQIAGSALIPTSPNSARADTHAVLWSNGKMIDLDTLGSHGCGADAINDAGQVIGSANIRNGTLAFLWAKGKMRTLGTLGGQLSEAYAINNKGEIVGGAQTANTALHAFVWRSDKMIDLGAPVGFPMSQAKGINDKGQIILHAFRDVMRPHSFIWANGQMIDLGTLGGDKTFASGINNMGMVVGQSATTNGTMRPFLWEAGRITDLNNLIPAQSERVLTSATAINDRGQITASGTLKGEMHAFLLTPL